MEDQEEFHEADVLWPDHHFHGDGCPGHQKQLKGRGQHAHGHAACGCEVGRPASSSSAPVAIPVAVRPSESSWARRSNDDEASTFVPPHLLVARRRCSEEERAVASSMRAGQGRTLKGRDLQCVRAAVLRMTGFLET